MLFLICFFNMKHHCCVQKKRFQLTFFTFIFGFTLYSALKKAEVMYCGLWMVWRDLLEEIMVLINQQRVAVLLNSDMFSPSLHPLLVFNEIFSFILAFCVRQYWLRCSHTNSTVQVVVWRWLVVWLCFCLDACWFGVGVLDWSWIWGMKGWGQGVNLEAHL